MGNNQGQALSARESRGGQPRRVRAMSEAARISADVLPLPERPPFLMENPDTPDGPKAIECPVVFRWVFGQGFQPRQVQIAGSWDGWKGKIPLVKSSADFTTIVDLQPGDYEYKFLVDGMWVIDDTQPTIESSIGASNNVIKVDESDFAVFDALEKDFEASSAGEAQREGGNANTKDTPNDKELEKLRSFSQEIPSLDSLKTAHGPPQMPAQLQKVLLNQETPESCDPNVLPEPNHVSLNHMYALSIKDQVMVLSATQRYRKKFVTTLLYKPLED